MSNADKLTKALTECFNDIDKDKSGFIEQKELEALLKAYFSHPDCPPSYKAQNNDAEIKKVAGVSDRRILRVILLTSCSIA